MPGRYRLVLSALLLVLVASGAAAEPSTASRLTWVTNGTVRAAAVHDQTLYIGGSFTRVAPAANFLGPWFGVSTTTGAAGPRLPLADGAVFALEPDGAGGFYVAGRFAHIGGVARAGLAHVRADGVVDPAFAPALHPVLESSFDLVPVLEVRALARVGGRLLVGGTFRIEGGGSSREGLAALDAATGVLDAGFQTLPVRAERFLTDGPHVVIMGRVAAPPANVGAVVTRIDAATGATMWTQGLGQDGAALDAVVAGGRLIVVGSFARFNTNSWQTAMVSLDPMSGAVDPAWSPVPTYYSYPVDRPSMHAVAAIGGTLYVGGRFSTLNNQPRSGLAAVDIAAGTITSWAPEVNGTVWDLAPASGSSLYVAGAFSRAASMAREGLAEIDTAGAPSSWTAQASSSDVRALALTGTTLLAGGTSAVFGGVPRSNLAAFALDADEVQAWAPEAGYPVESLATDGARVFAGLLQTNVAGGFVPRVGVVAFDAHTGDPSSWTAPDLSNGLLGLVDGHVYVSVGFSGLRRVETTSGRVDPSIDLPGSPALAGLLPLGDRLYVYHQLVDGLAAYDTRTGARSPWRPAGLPDLSNHFVRAAAAMGQTIFLAYRQVFTGTEGLMAVDADSGVAVAFAGAVSGSVEGLAVADGLVLVASLPEARGGASVSAVRPDGTASGWNPGLAPTDYDARLRTGVLRRPLSRVVVTDTDVIVTGVQQLGPALVHGVAVFSRDVPRAPASLDATVLDNAVRLSWTPPVPAASSYTIEVGSRAGASDVLVQDTGSSTPVLDATAPGGTYFVRVRSTGAPTGAASAASNEVAVRVGCVVPRLPPTRLAATLAGTTVTLSWTAPAFIPVARYVVEAGSESGASNLAQLVLTGTDTSFTTPAPRGTYFVRVRAENACGVSPASSQIWITVGDDAMPAAPTGLLIAGAVPAYTAQWSPVPGATAYLVEVGSEPGLANLATLVTTGTSLGPATVSPGQTYYVRVRAVGAAGLGPPSEEYVLIAR